MLIVNNVLSCVPSWVGRRFNVEQLLTEERAVPPGLQITSERDPGQFDFGCFYGIEVGESRQPCSVGKF